jgi:hypothetical protein
VKIVGAYACSHAGLIISHEAKADPGQRDRIYAGFDVMRREIEALKPDAIYILATDHGRIYPLTMLPPFVIGVSESAHGIGDAGIPECDVPLHQAFARSILDGAFEQGIDLVYSEEMKIDHSFVCPLTFLTPKFDVPIVPMVQNCSRPPLPTLGRSHDVGAKLGAAIRNGRNGSDGRIVVIGTGGLSHWVGSPERQAFLRRPPGDRYGHEAEFPVVIGDRGEINDTFDRMFLDRLARGEAPAFAAEWTNDHLVEEAGNGAQEVRNWLTIAGLVEDRPLELIAYEPIPEWHTGTAVARFRLD